MKNKNFLKNIKFKKQFNCISCNSSKHSNKIITLPKFPITEFYRNSKDKLEKKSFIDQSVFYCSKCDHAFLNKILDIGQIYSNYITSTSSSKGAIDCLKSFYNFILENTTEVTKFDVVDIGGNDSLFLSFFKKNKYKINIDPNGYSKYKNIKVMKFFLENIDFTKIKKKNETLYVSSHTLEHLENPNKLFFQLNKVLKKKDEIYLQFPSLEKMIELRRFDQLCHQHINYFSLESIKKLMLKFDLYINAYEYDTNHFGTLRLKVTRNKKNNVLVYRRNSYQKIRKVYKEYLLFNKHLNKNLLSIFNNGQGFGAGLMVPILAYYLPVINKLKYIIDENKFKNNKKYINLKPVIRNLKYLKKDKPILITSVSTQEAAKMINKKLVEIGVKNIALPVMIN
jgi:hypothetical protein